MSWHRSKAAPLQSALADAAVPRADPGNSERTPATSGGPVLWLFTPALNPRAESGSLFGTKPAKNAAFQRSQVLSSSFFATSPHRPVYSR